MADGAHDDFALFTHAAIDLQLIEQVSLAPVGHVDRDQSSGHLSRALSVFGGNKLLTFH